MLREKATQPPSYVVRSTQDGPTKLVGHADTGQAPVSGASRVCPHIGTVVGAAPGSLTSLVMDIVAHNK